VLRQSYSRKDSRDKVAQPDERNSAKDKDHANHGAHDGEHEARRNYSLKKSVHVQEM